MRSFDKYRDTKFVQKTDVEKGALVTIATITEENVAPNNQPEEMKFVLNFKENIKPWVPNIGSLEEISRIAGTGDVDKWPGTIIVMYVNPDVEFAGKRVGGIRCRAPKNQPPVNEQPPATQPSGENPDWVGDDPAPPTDEIAF